MSTPRGDLDFTNKVVLVTGGSRGIGAAMVRAFAARGAKTIVNYVTDPDGRNEADAKALVHEIEHAVAIHADVSKPKDVAEMLEVVRGIHGGVDVLINNAGVLRDRSLKKMTEEDWNFVLRVNLDGTFHCTQAAVASGLLRAGGRVVNLASVAAFGGFFGQANYAASKAGIVALTKVAARELAKQQITVNAIAPGFIDTDMVKSMPPEVTQQFLQQIPLARAGKVDDVVGAALYLCSDLAAYVTGQVIHVNGGFWMP